MMSGVFGKFITLVAGIGYLVAAIFSGNGFDSTSNYKKHVAEYTKYENTLEDAIPQTEMYNYIKDFLAGKTEGKERKCIVIGYDGCRADMLGYAKDGESAINYLQSGADSQTFLTYCGGTNWPYWNSQASSTAPGWCSILTGVWADVHGVTDNDIVKNPECRTLITSLVEDGTIDASAFIVSWSGHFDNTDSVYDPETSESTYCEEKDYAEKKGLNASFIRSTTDDVGTKEYTLAEIAKSDCADFIFSIFEYTDHVGHDVGFSYFNSDYENAFYDADATALDIIKAIEARPTYENEDWLIILTADHGGSTLGHGGPTIMERMTWIVSNKTIEDFT